MTQLFFATIEEAVDAAKAACNGHDYTLDHLPPRGFTYEIDPEPPRPVDDYDGIELTDPEPEEWGREYDENMHEAFVRDYGALMNHPARVSKEKWDETVDGNCREIVDAVVNQSLHIDLTIYDKGEQKPTFGLCVRELTEYCSMCEHVAPHLTDDPDRIYFFRFTTRQEALLFVHAITFVGDDLV